MWRPLGLPDECVCTPMCSQEIAGLPVAGSRVSELRYCTVPKSIPSVESGAILLQDTDPHSQHDFLYIISSCRNSNHRHIHKSGLGTTSSTSSFPAKAQQSDKCEQCRRLKQRGKEVTGGTNLTLSCKHKFASLVATIRSPKE